MLNIKSNIVKSKESIIWTLNPWVTRPDSIAGGMCQTEICDREYSYENMDQFENCFEGMKSIIIVRMNSSFIGETYCL